MKKVVILFSGEGLNAQNIVKVLHKKECEIVCAITNKKDAKGIQRLEDLSINVEILEHIHFEDRESFDMDLVKLINSYEPDLVVLSGFMRILTEVFTSNVKSINLHPSLLPKYKGAKAIERSYDANDAKAGVSVHHVSSELDGGDIILQKSFVRTQSETYESFCAKIKTIEFEIMPEAILKVLKE